MQVGVVIPVRGPAPFLDEALATVLAERPAQVVVVDDGSAEPVRPAGVDAVRLDTPGGPAAARNAGVAALGEGIDAIAFCDADDTWEPGSLSLRLQALAAEPACALVFGRARVVGPDGADTGERWPLPGTDLTEPAALYAHNPILTSSVVVRRDAFAGFDVAYAQAEDWELWLRLLRAGHRLRPVPGAEVRYRRHGGGLTADVLALARAQQRLHEAYGDVVPAAERDRVLAADRASIAEGLLRARRYGEARALMAPGPRRTVAAVPGLRALLGRADPYRARRG
jgi:glycosyltransferase involved in cell wall biosynthesis